MHSIKALSTSINSPLSLFAKFLKAWVLYTDKKPEIGLFSGLNHSFN